MKYNNVNTKKILKLLLILTILSNFNLILYAQKLDTPLDPVQVIIKDWEIGGFIGLGANFSGGEYSAECPDCVFSGNSKFGYSLGLKTDYEITHNFYIGTNLIFDDFGANGSFRRFENVQLQRTDGSTMEVPIEFRQTLNLSLNSIGIVPNACFRIDDWLDLRLGAFADFLISNNVKHTKELLTKSVLLPDGEKVSVTIPGTTDNKKVIEDRAIPDLTNPQFGIFPQINFNIPMSKDNDFLIGAFMKIPLSNIASSQSGYSHYTWRIFLGLSFDLNDDEKSEIPVPRDK